MKGVGTFFIGLGILAIILHFFEKVPNMLSWIYNWGETVAWVIMIGLIVLGIIILAATRRR